MPAALLLPNTLNIMRHSLGAILKTSCCSTETITDGLAYVVGCGCDRVANAAADGSCYTACGCLDWMISVTGDSE